MKTFIIRFFSLFLLSITLTFCSNDSELDIYENKNSAVLDVDISYSQIEIDILNLVNKYRTENSLSKLATLNIVSSVADDHTKYMIENGIVSHDNFQERVTKLQNNANAKSIGENVAYGYNSAQAVLNGWLKSPEHKKIIETDSFTHFGISTETDENGRNYFTQIFIKK
jgi:uncharacterized protein YkwD